MNDAQFFSLFLMFFENWSPAYLNIKYVYTVIYIIILHVHTGFYLSQQLKDQILSQTILDTVKPHVVWWSVYLPLGLHSTSHNLVTEPVCIVIML